MSERWQVVARRDLIGSGVAEHHVRRMVASGAWHAPARGVVLVGPRLAGVEGWRQRLSVLAVQHPHACVWGQAAAALYDLDGFDAPVPIRLRVPPGSTGRSPHLVRRRLLTAPVEADGLTLSSVAETLLNLGHGLPPRPGCAAATRPLSAEQLVELALECALRRQLVTLDELESLVLATDNRTPGRAVLAAVLDARPPHARPTGSYLETRCHQVLREGAIADFDRQVEIAGRRGRIGFVDFALGRVVIEVVGAEWHLPTFNADHHRYGQLTAAGYRLVPLTFEDIEFHPGRTRQTVIDALDAQVPGSVVARSMS